MSDYTRRRPIGTILTNSFRCMQAMEALAIVFLWIQEGTAIRKQRREERLKQFCTRHPIIKKDMTYMKTTVMSISRATRYSVKKYMRVLEHAIDLRNDFSYAKKVVFKSRVWHTVRSEEWSYRIVPLAQLFPEAIAQYPTLQYL